MTCQDLAQALFFFAGMFVPGALIGLMGGFAISETLRRRKEDG